MQLDIYRVEIFDRARVWTDLNPEERRRRGVETCRDRDAEALWSLTEAYLTLHGASATGTSPRTLRAYRWAVNRFLDYAGNQAVNLLRATSGDGVRFVRSVEAAGSSASSTRVQLARVPLLCSALRWAEVTQAAPFADVKPIREKTAAWDKRSPYTHLEVQTLLDAVNPRTRALLLLCAHGGLRVSEALDLRWNDVTIETKSLTVRKGKGGKQRRVAMGESLKTALEALPEGDWVIGGSYPAAVERLQRLCNRAGVAYRGHHALRHYAGTRLTREGASLDDVAWHLGHATLETARIYAKWSDEELRRQMAA